MCRARRRPPAPPWGRPVAPPCSTAGTAAHGQPDDRDPHRRDLDPALRAVVQPVPLRAPPWVTSTGLVCNNGQPTCNCFRTPGLHDQSGNLGRAVERRCLVGRSTLLLGVKRSARRVLHWQRPASPSATNQAASCRTGPTAPGRSRQAPTPAGRQLPERLLHGGHRLQSRRTRQRRDAGRELERHQLDDPAHPQPPGPATSSLSGVSCSTATACTAVGSSTTASGPQIALAEQWNGTSWTPTPRAR